MASKAVANVPNLYSRLISLLPRQNIKFCFAYGSGVFEQANTEKSSKMIDFIIAVDDSSQWHKENILMNPSHYSSLRFLGHNIVSKVQTNFGANIYFNTLIPVRQENVMIKYGVISTEDLETDLLDWCHLYVAGRLHKPVKFIHPPSDSSLRTALQLNLHSAVHASLLYLPEHFTELEFYKTIASISYMGDFRMMIGEDKNKVNNIVTAQLPQFRKLYSPILKTVNDYLDIPKLQTEHSVCGGENLCSQDTSPSTKLFHFNQLPKTPQRNLVKIWNTLSKTRHDNEDVLYAMAHDPDCPLFVNTSLDQIVRTTSLTQSLKGIFTGGLVKSIKYSGRKLMKMMKSRK